MVNEQFRYNKCFSYFTAWTSNPFDAADHAIDWVFGPGLLSYAAAPCEDTCYGCAMHGMQSGLS